MKTLLLAVFALLPAAAAGQAMEGYNRAIREQEQYEQEREIRRIQIERAKQGLAEDPSLAQALRDADARRAPTECRTDRYYMNGSPVTCRVCPGRPTSCTY